MKSFDRTKEKTARARALRRPLSKPETVLWSYLRGGQLGAPFRKQHPIGPYYVDFYCAPLRLAIEIDGAQHRDQQDYDARRTAFIESKGIAVLRFWAGDVLSNVEGVGEAIKAEIAGRV